MLGGSSCNKDDGEYSYDDRKEADQESIKGLVEHGLSISDGHSLVLRNKL